MVGNLAYLPTGDMGPCSTEDLGMNCFSPTKPFQRKAKGKPPRASGSGIVPMPSPDQVSGLCVSADQKSDQAVSVISALQEFIQDSKTFRAPMRHSIIQWSFDERSVNSLSTQFRATAAFVLEGVPHHVVGDWQTSKNSAKRDAAERSLGLFVSQWGCQLLQEEQMEQMINSGLALDCPESESSLQTSKGDDQENTGTVAALHDFCMQFAPCCQTSPQLTTSLQGEACTGYAVISLFGVPHTFGGNACESEDDARNDVARRVLWYLQCPGFDDDFEVDIDALATLSQIAAPPSEWTVDGGL